MDQIQSFWYTWGAFVAFLITLLAAFWVFFDAQRKELDAVAWKMLTVLAVVLILPSVFLAAIPSFRDALATALLPLALLGTGATLLALLALVFFIAGIGTGAGMRCPNCGRPRDPSWPYCPYCEYDKPAAVPPPTPVYQPPPPTPVYQPPPPLPPTPVVPPQGATMALGPSGELIPPAPKAGETRILKAQPTYLAYLVIRAGIHEGKTYQLSDTTSIGRKADVNDIVLDDDSVSRQHARVRFQDGKFVLFDLASANGTFIQDAETGEWKKVQQRALTNGMLIKMGEAILSFMDVKAGKEKEHAPES